jgi:D-lyxose ketol-isomerase
MKRSEINKAIINTKRCFRENGWFLPPNPKWDITDFGLGSFLNSGLVLVNLTEEIEYCEKLMYVTENQITPAHCHKKKKEDIICRSGNLAVQLWISDPGMEKTKVDLEVKINGELCKVSSGAEISLEAGERITIEPGIWHKFYAQSKECIVGEVSTSNDDFNDNFFSDSKVGRFSKVIEDEPRILKLLNEND